MKTLTCLCLVFLMGCAQVNPVHNDELKTAAQSGRFQVTEFQQFNDGDRSRWIMAITDTKTGHEYIAVSGAGVEQICQFNPATKTENCN